LVSGGTDNHLLLVDVTPFGIGGKQAEEILEKAGISINKNMLPFDERKPMDPSGIRLGTPAITTRGFDEAATKKLGELIVSLLKQPTEAHAIEIAQHVEALARAFPLYPDAHPFLN
jgi:glycine hydroxymethyltransferase